MTAPDPRLNEIQARVDKTPPDHGHTQSWLPAADARYLLAELRKAHEALERVAALHVPNAGHNPDCECGIPPGDGARCCVCYGTWPCPTAAAVAAAKGDEG